MGKASKGTCKDVRGSCPGEGENNGSMPKTLQSKIEGLKKEIDELPILRRQMGLIKSECDAVGFTAIRYQCMACDKENWWGRWPKI